MIGTVLRALGFFAISALLLGEGLLILWASLGGSVPYTLEPKYVDLTQSELRVRGVRNLRLLSALRYLCHQLLVQRGRAPFMPFPSDCYDPETLDLMTRALDVAWNAVVMRRQDSDHPALHTLMEIKIMSAVRQGERDPARLSQLALELVDRP